MWKAYIEERRALGDPTAKPRPATRTRRQFPSLLEQLGGARRAARDGEQRAAQAERESEYFKAMMDTVAARARLDEDAVAEIRVRVRAAYEADVEAAPGI